MIAKELNQQGSHTIRGNPWCSSSVMGVVNNEKYMGDILLGKSFTDRSNFQKKIGKSRGKRIDSI